MATNPITSESLTVDFKSLMSIPVGDRARAASLNQDFLQSILNALTPIQIAKAFPDYYRRSLPDITNFLTSYIQTRNGGTYNQTGGGDGGYTAAGYDQGNNVNGSARPRGAPEPTIKEMKEKLLKSGIDVDSTYATLNQGAILEGDDRYDYLKTMSDDELKAVGMQRSQDENGKTLIQLLPTEASALSDQEVMKRASDKFVPGTTGLEGRAALAKQAYDAFVEAGLSDKQARAAVAEVNRENSLSPKYMFGTHTEMAAQAGGRTNYGMFSWGDPSRVKNFKAYMQENGVMDPAGNLLVDNNTYLKQQAKFAVQEMQGYESGRKFLENKDVSSDDATNLLGRYIGWDMAGRRHDASASYDRLREGRKIIDEVNEKMGKILPSNPTDAQIEEARKILEQKEREGQSEALIRQQFNQASPTSSEAIPDPEGRTVIESQGEVAAVRRQPITPELKEVLQYAGEESGVVVEVFSGGQNDITQGGPRTGTERHDLGHAADVKLKVKGPDGKMRTLDSRNPEDRAIMGKFVETARMMGTKGIGSGLGYMGESGIHIGTVMRPDLDYSNKEYGAPAGKEAVWLSDKWTQEAFSRGQQAAVDFEKAGGMAEYRKRREEKIAEQEKKESDKTAAAKQETVQINNEVIPHDHAGETAEEHAAENTTVAAAEPATPPPATPAATPAPQFALGGNMYGVNEDMTLVETSTGNPIAQIGQNEKIEKQGNAIQVTPETKLKADELTEKYEDSSSVMEDRMSDIEDRIDNQSVNTPSAQRAREPEKTQSNPSEKWREAVVAGERPVSPSFNRAMARTKFFPEGHHFNRSAPGSQS